MTDQYYCYQSIGGLMYFIKRLLNCGCTEENEKNAISVSNLCVKRKDRPSGDISVSGKSATSSTHPNSAKLKGQMGEVKNYKRRPMPQFNFINCQDLRKHKDHGLDLGYLVGGVNLNKKVSVWFGGDSMVVQIGKKQEINSLSALRPGSLDSLVILWNQQGYEFSKEELMITDQRLVLVFQQWDTLLQILKSLQSDLLQLIGQCSLKQVLKRLICKVYKKEHYFLLEFQTETVAQSHIKKQIEKLIEVEIQIEWVQKLFEKMTLQDYSKLKNHDETEFSKIRYFLKEIQLEIMNKRSKTVPTIISDPDQQKKESQHKQVISEKPMKSSDINQEELQYYAKRINDSPSPQFDFHIEGDLDIFNYNFNEYDFLECMESPSKRSNMMSPSKGSRKIRTRSQELSPSEIFDCWDDEIFDKYR